MSWITRWITADWKTSFYQTATGVEIGLVLQKGQRQIAVEFKASSAPEVGKGFWTARGCGYPIQVILLPYRSPFAADISMRVTSKGQVTIPLAIRNKYGILPHSEVEFVEEDGRVVLRKQDGKSRMRERLGRLRGSATHRMGTDEIMALTRGEE